MPFNPHQPHISCLMYSSFSQPIATLSLANDICLPRWFHFPSWIMASSIFFQYLCCSWISSWGLTAHPHLISSPQFSSNICLPGYHPLISSPGCTAAASCLKLLLLLSSSVHVLWVFSLWSFLLCAACTHKRGHRKCKKRTFSFSGQQCLDLDYCTLPSMC